MHGIIEKRWDGSVASLLTFWNKQFWKRTNRPIASSRNILQGDYCDTANVNR
ncbi:hypothetical protein LMF89_21590 [Pelosinus sp. Bkl1]|uniref:Uncharacterized protein n=1 Tax=Pelosinus baikalensis TaxID=2892015 RepID=A0ABS8I083_9FIRM|nr:hypothetical protein [Pelosinus baikalensis]